MAFLPVFKWNLCSFNERYVLIFDKINFYSQFLLARSTNAPPMSWHASVLCCVFPGFIQFKKVFIKQFVINNSCRRKVIYQAI